MSARGLRVGDLTPELEAALVGDFPTLRQGSSDAQQLARAFGPDAAPRWWQEHAPKSPVGHAAKAVSLERSGDVEPAVAIYSGLAAEQGWVGLLGALLLAWSSGSEEPQPLHDARTALDSLRLGQRRARLLAKLATFAFDKRQGELGRETWKEAIRSARGGTLLEHALRIEGRNIGVEPEHELPPQRPDEADDMVDLPWLDELRLKAATGMLYEAVEDQAQATWGYTLRMGVTRLDEIIAAEIQVTWIGALWWRRAVRRQLGAQLLNGAAQTPEEWAWAVTMWTFGGSHQPQKALRLAEPHLGRHGADEIVRSVAELEDSTRNQQRSVELAAEAWDLISDGLLRSTVAQVPLLVGPAWPAPQTRIIWAAYALRLTEEWLAAYSALEPESQAALVETFNAQAVHDLDAPARKALYRAAVENLPRNEGDVNAALPIIAALAPGSDRDWVRDLVTRRASPSTIARLLVDQPEFVDEATARDAESKLAQAVRDQSREAKHGKQIIGGTSVRLDLGRIEASIREPRQGLVDLLLETAMDPELPPDYLLQARQALTLLRRAERLPGRHLRDLHQARDDARQDLDDRYLTRAVLHAFRLQILAKDLNAEERATLVAMARHAEDRVRDVAVSACAEAMEDIDDEGLAWGVVSGLFDPVDSVTRGALAGLRPLSVRFPAAAEVAWKRLPELLARGNRGLRAAVVFAAADVHPHNDALERIRQDLIERGRRDRSWRVREAALHIDRGSPERA